MNKWFTLVELVVTVVVLGILSTLGFVYMTWHTSSSRDAVRVSDMWKIQTAIENQIIQGVPLLAFTTGGQEIPGISIGGSSVIDSTQYVSWDILYSVLEVPEKVTQDPQWPTYKVWVTSKSKWKYQIAASLENQGEQKAKVLGNYRPRTQNAFDVTGTSWTREVFLTHPEDVIKVYPWDFITGVGIPTGTTIKSIGWDGMRLSLTHTLNSNITSLQLAQDETNGLIKSFDTNTPVIDAEQNLPY